MKVLVDIPDDQVEQWINLAHYLGYYREDPRNRWSDVERKEAIRFAIAHVNPRKL